MQNTKLEYNKRDVVFNC